MWTWDGGGTTHSSTQSAGVDEANAPGHGGGDRRGEGGGVGDRALACLRVGPPQFVLSRCWCGLWISDDVIDARASRRVAVAAASFCTGSGKANRGGRSLVLGRVWVVLSVRLVPDIRTPNLSITLGRAGLPKWASCVRSTREIQWAHQASAQLCVWLRYNSLFHTASE